MTFSDGKVASCGQVCRSFEEIQVSLLKEEGVKSTDGRVDMKRYQWKKRVF